MSTASSFLALVLLNVASGHVVTVTGGNGLAPTLWTPDDILIASDFGNPKTYAVATSGVATLINASVCGANWRQLVRPSSPAQPQRAPARASPG